MRSCGAAERIYRKHYRSGDARALGFVAAGFESSHETAVLQERMAASAGLFLDGLLGGERRKTGWSRAEAAGTEARRGDDRAAIAADVPIAWAEPARGSASETRWSSQRRGRPTPSTVTPTSRWLRRAGKGYVLGTNANHPFRSWGMEQRVSGTA